MLRLGPRRRGEQDRRRRAGLPELPGLQPARHRQRRRRRRPQPLQRRRRRLPRRPLQRRPAQRRGHHPGGRRPLRPRHGRRPQRPPRQPRNRPGLRQERPDPDPAAGHPARRPLDRRQPRPQPVHPQPDQLRTLGGRQAKRSRPWPDRPALQPLPGRRMRASSAFKPEAGAQASRARPSAPATRPCGRS